MSEEKFEPVSPLKRRNSFSFKKMKEDPQVDDRLS
jgi:hypothetical protein